MDKRDAALMGVAIEEARRSMEEGGIPIGAALASDGRLVAAGHNERIQRGDPIAHGEIACLRNAGRMASYSGTTLYTTLSPCEMCSGAVLLFRIPRLVVGERRTYPGDVGFLRSRGVEVVVLDDEECASMMLRFQREHPREWSEDIGGR
ncbi:nucleoside deaminase [Nonomuraea terrae]|uniref:Nucleoside deaminase n=1 Tax=Nonomuraea terrae TaxID=2530383 RepID=A0A4R4ZFY2_9ACTN|nr:nucleoside deaminase [Nonomuraea terrae]TDD56950.1 nucleoside deaminase [Nonomuraea terrae]